jgi:hypothetical protein
VVDEELIISNYFGTSYLFLILLAMGVSYTGSSMDNVYYIVLQYAHIL